MIHLQVRARDDTRVCRDLVALGKEHDVARHEVFCQDLLLLAVANHRGIGRQHLLERLGRLARTRLLPEAEHAVDDVHEPHCDAKLREPCDERDGARDPQKHRHKVCEVREKCDNGRFLLLALDDVFSEAPLAYGCLVRGEPDARRLKFAEHAVDGCLADGIERIQIRCGDGCRGT